MRGRTHHSTVPDRRGRTSIAPAGPAGFGPLSSSLSNLSSGRSILARLGAVFAIDAASSIPGEQWALNQGSGGQVLRARYGSVGRAEVRSGGMILPGVGGNYASAPDSAPLDITGDLELVARIAMDDWTPSTEQSIIEKNSGVGQVSWAFRLSTSGSLVLYVSPDGTAASSRTSPTLLNATPDGATLWVKATWRASDGQVAFYSAPDQDAEPTTWTALGTQTNAIGAIYASTSPLELGACNLGVNAPARGVYRRAIVRRGIGGPAVLDVDFAGAADLATSFTGAHGYGIKRQTFVQPGVAGVNATIPDSAPLSITGDLELVVRAAFDDNTPANYSSILCKNYLGYELRYEIGSNGNLVLEIFSGSTRVYTFPAFGAILTDGQTYWIKVTLDVDNGAGGSTARLYWAPDQDTEPTSWTLFGFNTIAAVMTLTDTSEPVTIGTRPDGSLPTPGRYRRAIIRNGIGGPTVLDVNPANVPNDAASFTAGHGYGIKNGSLVLPGVSGVYASVPDSPARVDNGETIEVMARVSLADWTPAPSEWAIFGKWNQATHRNWLLTVTTAGRLQFYWSPTAASSSAISDTPTGFADGSTQWVRVCHDCNGGESVTTFYTAPDGPDVPTVWSQLGSPVVGTGKQTSIGTSAVPIDVGAWDAGAHGLGRPTVRRAIVRNGIAGPIVLDVDFSGQADDTASFPCATGQTVTVNGCALPTVTINGGARPTVTVTATNAVDTNDPLLLPHTGTNYLYSAGSPGKPVVTVPDRPSPTTSFSARALFAMDDWTPASAAPAFFSHSGFGSPELSIQMGIISPGGHVVVLLSTSGTAWDFNSSSTVAPTVTDGSPLAVRVDWTASPAEVRIYTKNISPGGSQLASLRDDTGWTQLGATLTAGVPSSPLFNTTYPMGIGATSFGGQTWPGKYHAFSYRVDGTEVEAIDFGKVTTHDTFLTEYGTTATIWRATSGRKTAVVTRPVWLFGTDDFLEVADNDLLEINAGQDFAIVVVARVFGSTDAMLIAKKNNGALAAGWWMRRVTSTNQQVLVDDGTSQSALGDATNTDGTLRVYVMTRTGTTLRGYVSNNVTANITDVTTGNHANALPMRIGGSSNGVIPLDGEVLEVGIVRGTWTATEVAAVVSAHNAAP